MVLVKNPNISSTSERTDNGSGVSGVAFNCQISKLSYQQVSIPGIP